MIAPSPLAPAESRPRGSRVRRRASFLGVLGEILVTVGVVALLYASWQLWVGDVLIASQKHADAATLTQRWADHPAVPETEPSTDPDAVEAAIPVLGAQAHGEEFAVMRVPRFGSEWTFPIASGTSRPDILDQGEIGHYPETAMPGEIGNTAYAAHRWTSGAPFDPIDRLVVGDAIVVETEAGWYTYRFRSSEYVQATRVQVLLPVPNREGVAADGRYLTLTSCAPKFDMRERIVAYALFEDFTPRSAGAPASLTEEAAA